MEAQTKQKLFAASMVLFAAGIVILLQLTGVINLIKSPADFCPTVGENVLCGICNKDIKLSDNPYAGQCRICPKGTFCTGDVCGDIKCIPMGTIGNLTGRNFITLKNITYVSKSGATWVEPDAFPGYVYVLTAYNKEAQARSLFESNGGKVYAAKPAMGWYIVQVAEGKESDFLSAMYKSSLVRDGFPMSPPMKGAISVYDYFSDQGLFDGKKKWDCGKDHGNIVAYLAGKWKSNVTTIELPHEDEFAEVPAFNIIDSMKEKMITSWSECENVVFSLSLQSRTSGLTESRNKSGCTEPRCERIRAAQKEWYTMYLDFLRSMYETEPSMLDSVIIVIIAGNAGVDLDKQINELRNEYPDVFKNMIIVGSIDYNTDDITVDFNHLINNTFGSHPNMVYATGGYLPIAKFDKEFGQDIEMASCQGTSFAAPQVSAAIDYIWRMGKTRTAGQVVDAFDLALKELGNESRIPQRKEYWEKHIDQAFIMKGVNNLQKMPKRENISGRWVGTLKSESISQAAFRCDTLTDVPVDICMQQGCRTFTGNITFPKGSAGKITSPEEGAVCFGQILPSGQDCNFLEGTLLNRTATLNSLNINCGEYVPGEYNPENAQHSASMKNDTLEVNFSSIGYSGRTTYSSMNGTMKVKKVSEECDLVRVSW